MGSVRGQCPVVRFIAGSARRIRSRSCCRQRPGAPDVRESFRSSCAHTGLRGLPEPRGDVQETCRKDMAADPIVIA